MLGFIIFQDLKNRAIHVLLPISIFLIALAINYLSDHLNFLMCITNIGFVVVNIVGLTLYFSLKNRKLINPIDSMIGLGDILFLISITPLFSLKSYILLFIVGMAFSLVLHLIINVLRKQNSVPLAGYLSIYFIGFLFFEQILNFNFILY